MYQYSSKQNETKQNVIHEENEWNIEYPLSIGVTCSLLHD